MGSFFLTMFYKLFIVFCKSELKICHVIIIHFQSEDALGTGPTLYTFSKQNKIVKLIFIVFFFLSWFVCYVLFLDSEIQAKFLRCSVKSIFHQFHHSYQVSFISTHIHVKFQILFAVLTFSHFKHLGLWFKFIGFINLLLCLRRCNIFNIYFIIPRAHRDMACTTHHTLGSPFIK